MAPKKPPQTSAGISEEPRIIRPTRRVAALLGFLLKAEVDAIFQQQPFEAESGVDASELWRDFDARRQQLPPIGQGQIENLPASAETMIHEIKNRKTYKKYYEAIAEYTFGLAPIAVLLAPQWYADLDYIDELAAALNNRMTLEEQLRFALSEGRITEPIVTGTQVLFTSPRRDLFADPIPKVREVEGDEFEIVIRASSRPNYIQVAQIGERLVLTNGVHKVCALSKLGFTHCPCLFRVAHNLEEAGLNPRSTTLFREPIVNGPRPALVHDFLNPNAAVLLKMRSMYQVLQVSVGTATITVPALPEISVESKTQG